MRSLVLRPVETVGPEPTKILNPYAILGDVVRVADILIAGL